jgi:hypothetical protein
VGCNKTYKVNRIILPPKQPGGTNEDWTDVRSVVVVGANGSGKSRVGAWIEQNDTFAPVHRVSAQRALVVPDLINPMPYDRAASQLHYGSYEPTWNEAQHRQNKIGRRWGNEPLSHMLSDYELVLSTLFADESKRNRDYAIASQVSIPVTKPPDCNLDVLQRIWAAVFPHRQLVIALDKIAARVPNSQQQYAGKMMSDGERVALYLIGHVLSAPPNAIVVIDEPEIHLHRAIQAVLWDQIELGRLDCLFVYITHDLDFAGTRSGARKIWMKSFDGTQWCWDELPASPGLPEQLLLHVLGSRRPVLFVEGDQNSHDAALYRALYPDQMIVPLDSCHRVIDTDKAMRQLHGLHHLETSGLVDRDHRSDDEIAVLRKSGLRVAEVTEVENLLCIPAALEAAAAQIKSTDINAAVAAAQQRVLLELKKGIEAQIASRAIGEIQFRLAGFGPKAGNVDATTIQAEVQKYVATIDVMNTFKRSRDLFEDIVARGDYEAALRYYNCKGITSFVAGALGLKTSAYCTMIVGIIQSSPTGILADEMRRRVS